MIKKQLKAVDWKTLSDESVRRIQVLSRIKGITYVEAANLLKDGQQDLTQYGG